MLGWSRTAISRRHILIAVGWNCQVDLTTWQFQRKTCWAKPLTAPCRMELWQRLWDVGRSTFLASADPLSPFPPHLQGIWTGTWRPPWFGCYTNDENVQMMHWQAVAGNLPEMLVPLRRLIKESLPDWRANAQRLYGVNGVLAPLQQGGGLADHQQAEWLGWTGGAGWLARHVWDAWLLSGNDAIARNDLLPLLREIIDFYDGFLERGTDGMRHAIPSISVENKPVGWAGRWTIDATMEIAIAREVVRHAITVAELIGEAVPATWRQLLQELPAYRLNDRGELAEWIHPEHHDHHQHRHLSHIYPLFPGDEFHDGPAALLRGVRRAVDARLADGQQSQTGWSLVHLANIYARLGDGAAVQGCLERMMRTCLQDNLMTVHDDWRGQGLTMGAGYRERGVLQLDALYGANAAMLECLVQSERGSLVLLPALLPAWPRGAVRGLGTRCGVTVDL